MSTSTIPSGPRLLRGVPTGLRDPLLQEYSKIVHNYREARWEPAELNGGKLCEIVYSILHGYTAGAFPAGPSKPANMVDACRALEKADSIRFSRSVRIQIPRMLVALYEIRNSRGVGHVGGDVNPNHMDATVILSMAKWIMAELIRLFHAVDTATATAAVDALVERTLPLIWVVGGKLRILNPSLSARDKMLAILYSRNEPVSVYDIADWIEYSNLSRFRTHVVKQAHASRLVEFNPQAGTVVLSPLGVRYVETKIDLEV